MGNWTGLGPEPSGESKSGRGCIGNKCVPRASGGLAGVGDHGELDWVGS